MPIRPRKPCARPLCAELVPVGTSYCKDHDRARRKAQNDARSEWTHRLYGTRWQKARLSFLSRSPLCVDCKDRGLIKTATVVDHVKPHKGDIGLFWDVDNWQPLCVSCHTRKTAREGGPKSLQSGGRKNDGTPSNFRSQRKVL